MTQARGRGRPTTRPFPRQNTITVSASCLLRCRRHSFSFGMPRLSAFLQSLPRLVAFGHVRVLVASRFGMLGRESATERTATDATYFVCGVNRSAPSPLPVCLGAFKPQALFPPTSLLRLANCSPAYLAPLCRLRHVLAPTRFRPRPASSNLPSGRYFFLQPLRLALQVYSPQGSWQGRRVCRNKQVMEASQSYMIIWHDWI